MRNLIRGAIVGLLAGWMVVTMNDHATSQPTGANVEACEFGNQVEVNRKYVQDGGGTFTVYSATETADIMRVLTERGGAAPFGSADGIVMATFPGSDGILVGFVQKGCIVYVVRGFKVEGWNTVLREAGIIKS